MLNICPFFYIFARTSRSSTYEKQQRVMSIKLYVRVTGRCCLLCLFRNQGLYSCTFLSLFFFFSQDERCVDAVVAALAPLVGPEASRLVAARSRPAVLLHGPATAEGGGNLVEAAAERVRLFYEFTRTKHRKPIMSRQLYASHRPINLATEYIDPSIYLAVLYLAYLIFVIHCMYCCLLVLLVVVPMVGGVSDIHGSLLSVPVRRKQEKFVRDR